MKRHARALLCICLLCIPAVMAAQEESKHDHGVFVSPKNEFFDEITRTADAYIRRESSPTTVFRMDFSGVKAPTSLDSFKTVWHQPPISQGLTGTCWCFSATSFYESEFHRLTGKEIKLSEMYTVYWEYVEKAKRYARERGASEFSEGSESNAVPRIWREYGIVPASAYPGMLTGQKYHDHRALVDEMTQYLKSVKNSAAWDEGQVVETIRGILDHYLGKPPSTVSINGRTMTPKEYLTNVVRLPLDDYVEVMSLMEKPYFSMAEYAVGDNWWHSSDYLNVPLADFMETIKRAIRKGYSICIGGDTSEPGYDGHAGVGVIPTFDIPSDCIDENARQFRFSNHTTTDDHGIHLVGWSVVDGKDWYLIKDSGASSRNSPHSGYYFWHEDYVKLKMMTFTVHKDLVQNLLGKVSAGGTKER